MPNFLRFGIPSLDKLIGSHGEANYGINLRAKDGGKTEIQDATGICIMGPDGTGKSVFALHLASQYMADCVDEKDGDLSIELPKIYYISTDLNHDKAERMWKNFVLNRPFNRTVPFEKVEYSRENLKEIEIELKSYPPQQVASYIQPEKKPNKNNGPSPAAHQSRNYQVCFIDLASTTAGDDWGFTHRLLALMQQPTDGHPRHLVIIDAVEGFETYTGQLDAFGEVSSRRARIAQLARLAVKKTHVLLIVEEMRTMQRLPEEFVTDVVIRLRNVEANKYLRRTVEVEKARGQSLVRGQHPFSIRKGKGSTTGSQENVDDPHIPAVNSKPKKTKGSAGAQDITRAQAESFEQRETVYRYQDYVQVFPSLNYLNRAIMETTHAPRESPPKNTYAAFGIRYLDNMLGGEGFEAEFKPDDYTDTRGLPCGTVTALIGDSLTQKTRLGRSFLSRCFNQLQPKTLKSIAEELEKNGVASTLEEIKQLKHDRQYLQDDDQFGQEKMHRDLKRLKEIIVSQDAAQALLKKCGVAVLFTTQDTHHEALADEFLDKGLSVKLKENSDEKLIAEILIESRTICRRMEIHDVPTSVLVHIFERNIRKAQQILVGGSPFKSNEIVNLSNRIRVVLDDFSAFRNTYHEVREDPLFLPYLPFFLGRKGVTALIVDTQSISRPDLTLTERYESELRELVQFRLYTWRVPFYGDNRVAITAIPPFSPNTAGSIRELRWESFEDASGATDASSTLQVNPHFELYAGLEEGNLHPVPIEIRFYAENAGFNRYLESEEVIFAELFTPYKREGQTDKAKVLFSYGMEEYNMMRDFCALQRGTRLDHTLVFQVDEFWTFRRPKSGRTGAIRPQWNYLTTPTWNAENKRDAVADTYGIFQPTREEEEDILQPTEEKEEQDKEKFMRVDFYEKNHLPYVMDYEAVMARKTPEGKAFKEKLQKNLDRIPFSWDFGFVLCKSNAWADAANEDIFREKAKEEREFMSKLWGRGRQNRTIKIEEVWNCLTKAELDEDDPEQKPKRKRRISWFEFLAACKKVAEQQSYKNPSMAHTFDFSVFSPESFPCLILEIWVSEIFKSAAKKKKDGHAYRKELIEKLSERTPISQPDENSLSVLKLLERDRSRKLCDCLTERYMNEGSAQPGSGFSLELYKTWLLLIEAIDFSSLISSPNTFSLELKPRQVSSSVIAARHWYKTACQFIESISEQELETNWVPVRLPGHFSVRGDWFLTVAGGSRSSRLASRALDLLSSKRANLARLHEGIGLPVRKLFKSKEDCHLRTRLITSDGKQLTKLPYRALLNITEDRGDDFYWLWRSNLHGYNEGLRIWQRWLSQMIFWWHSLRLKYASNWTSGFEIYARLENLELCKTGRAEKCKELLELLDGLDSWKDFHKMVDALIDSLKQVSVEV